MRSIFVVVANNPLIQQWQTKLSKLIFYHTPSLFVSINWRQNDVTNQLALLPSGIFDSSTIHSVE